MNKETQHDYTAAISGVIDPNRPNAPKYLIVISIGPIVCKRDE